ncbi:MAG: COG3904 family protein [Allorhizobium sp.]
MSFIIVRSTGCQTDCLEWISGEGRITSDTPARLKKVLKSMGNRKLPIVLLSGGGDVDAALQMGRMIRKAGLETAIGATRLKGCPTMEPRCRGGVAKKGASEGQAFSWGAYCFSACPFMLAGGTVRSASQWSSLGVHQITTTRQSIHVTYQIQYKMVNGKKKEVSRKEVRRKLKDEGQTTKLSKKLQARLDAYFKEMGIDLNIMEFVSSVGPHNMRMLSTVEALRLGLLTDMLASYEMPGMRLCTEKDGLEVRCHRRWPLPSAPGTAAATAPAAVLPAPVEQPAVAITTAQEG